MRCEGERQPNNFPPQGSYLSRGRAKARMWAQGNYGMDDADVPSSACTMQMFSCLREDLAS